MVLILQQEILSRYWTSVQDGVHYAKNIFFDTATPDAAGKGPGDAPTQAYVVFALLHRDRVLISIKSNATKACS